jgi:hypothetical protein
MGERGNILENKRALSKVEVVTADVSNTASVQTEDVHNGMF